MTDDLLIAYLEDELDQELRSEVEQAVLEDQSIAEKLAAFKLSLEALDYAHSTDLKQRMKTWTSKIESTDEVFSPDNIRNTTKYGMLMGIAAGLILLVAALWLFRQSESQDDLLVDYYHSPVTNLTRSADENKSDEYLDLARAYSAKNHSDVVAMAQKMNTDDADYESSRFILLDAYIHLGELDAALETINSEILNCNAQNENCDRWEWQLVLLRLRRNEIDEARMKLTTINNDVNHKYHARSIELLKKMTDN